jgi:site-specific recombinase XerD
VSSLRPIAPEAAVELYLEHRQDELSDATHESHGYRLERFVEWCEANGFENMNELDGRDLNTFSAERRADGDLEPVTLRGQLSTLRVFLDYCESIDAVREGLSEKVLIPSVSAQDQAKDSKLDFERAEALLDYLSQYHYASDRHVVFALLWRTGIRLGSLRALDLRDFDSDEPALKIRHRPKTGTPLKNGESGQRMVALTERLANTIEDYVDGPRIETTDDEGRSPLITTNRGRPVRSTIRSMVYRITQPCWTGGCPHDRDPDTCEATDYAKLSKCPSARPPHDVRRGAITAHLLDDVPAKIVSDRMNVSEEVLDQHYDKRSERERMRQRRDYL